MPIPKPKGDESESDYVSRVMGDKSMQEYPEDQRAAIAHNTFREKSIGKTAKIMEELIAKAEEEEAFDQVSGEIPDTILESYDIPGQKKYKSIYVENRITGNTIEKSIEITSKIITRNFRTNKFAIVKEIGDILNQISRKVNG